MNCDSSNKPLQFMACVIDPLVNGFIVLLDACQRLMLKYVFAEGVITAYL